MLAPTYTEQRWASELPLTEALQFAEAKILKLTAERSTALLDLNHPWRSEAIDPMGAQVAYAERLGINVYRPGMNKGMLSDLIEAEKAARAERRKAKQNTYNIKYAKEHAKR